jgi:two-component system heavy metal sensor histidine kinase CusS
MSKSNWRIRNSLSARLMFYSFIMTFTLLIGSWIVMYFFAKQGLRLQDEGALKDRMSTVRALLIAERGPSERLRQRVEREWYAKDFERIFVRISDANHHEVIETPHLKDQNPQALAWLNTLAFDRSAQDLPRRLEDGDNIYQGASFNVSIPESAQIYQVEIALDRSSEHSVLAHLRLSFILLLVIGGVASLWTGRAVVKIALRPIQDVSLIAARVNSDRLNERIDPQTLPQEFTELAVTMNDMLDRLNESFSRLTRFSEDMAHELRTPVNNLLGSMEVGLARERSVGEYQNLLGSGIEECGRLKRIIDSLLFIARTSDPAQKLEKQRLNLADELSAIVAFYEASAEEQQVKLRLEGTQDVYVISDRIHLQRCIGNLLSNSIRHSPSGSEIIIRVESSKAWIAVKVVDAGCGIPNEALSRVGERFFRVEASRAKIYGGTGLGLSIVKSIVQIHGGHMQVESTEGHGTTVSLFFQT